MKIKEIMELNSVIINNQGLKMWIKEYRNSRDVDIEFEDGYVVYNQDMRNFRKKGIKNPNSRNLCGIGFIGQGIYSSKLNKKVYYTWSGMIKRCYGNGNKYPTYKEVIVCEEWHNFQNFAKWYDENYYEVEGETMCLDKDILIKGNKIYSPNTCVFAPQGINTLFTKRQNDRGKHPIGVTLGRSGKYEVWCNIKGRQKYESSYDNVEDAFNKYKLTKEFEIKRVADTYKELMPSKLYEALINYKVEITD